ncbi:MAG: ROK family protein [Alphaproteobacteria bacterium]|jgi:fructokinase|nr:ROK family protein [Alphaproteobacteria bacterium]MDP6875358.1 ROK family protein [Alphaproteobacteria bacterium]
MRIGVDLGGTKIEALALADDGSEIGRLRVPTPKGDYGGIIAAIRDLLAALMQGPTEDGLPVGVAIPGAVSPATGLIKNANSTCLIGKPFDDDLAAALGRPVRLANDANCFALSEASDGAAAGADSVFGVIVGTGTGAGIVLGGRLHEGPNLIAGEWGHAPLPWPDDDERPGPSCYCGRRGCIETFLSGPGLSRSYEEVAGTFLAAHEVAERAGQGDAVAEECMARYERRMAKSLAMVISILDPEVIVMGGGVSNISRLYDNVPRLWGEFAFSDELSTRLVRARHGDSSGVRGAAWLWPLPAEPGGG